MSIHLAGINIIITAQQFNPSVFNLLWLVKTGLIKEDEVMAGWVFTEPLVQINTSDFALVVVPDQLQFYPLKPDQDSSDEDVQDMIIEKLGRIITHLPHTPYTAIGLNFLWHLRPEDEDIRQLTRRLFYWSGSSFFKNFNEDNAKFGGYASLDMFDCRLKIDAKPVAIGGIGEALQFSFNFNKDLTDSKDSVTAAIDLLKRWSEAKAVALNFVESTNTRTRI